MSVVAAASLATSRKVTVACLGQKGTSSFNASSKTCTVAVVVAGKAQVTTADYCFGTYPDIAAEAARLAGSFGSTAVAVGCLSSVECSIGAGFGAAVADSVAIGHSKGEQGRSQTDWSSARCSS